MLKLMDKKYSQFSRIFFHLSLWAVLAGYVISLGSTKKESSVDKIFTFGVTFYGDAYVAKRQFAAFPSKGYLLLTSLSNHYLR